MSTCRWYRALEPFFVEHDIQSQFLCFGVILVSSFLLSVLKVLKKQVFLRTSIKEACVGTRSYRLFIPPNPMSE